MKTDKFLIFNAAIITGLTLLVTIPSLYGNSAGQPISFVNAKGENVLLFGTGQYKYDSVLQASGFLAQDLVVLFLVLPLFVYCLLLYLKKTAGADLLLMTLLGFFTYVYATMSLGAFYNSFFLAYIFIFSASLLSFIILFEQIYIPTRLTASFPRRGPAIFLGLSGLVTLFLWGWPLAESYILNVYPPILFHYTTLVTHVLDLAIIFPASVIAAVLIWNKQALGYKIAFPLLGLIILLIPIISLSTYFQIKNGIIFGPAEIAGPITGFLILGIFAVEILRKILMKVSSAAPLNYQKN